METAKEKQYRVSLEKRLTKVEATVLALSGLLVRLDKQRDAASRRAGDRLDTFDTRLDRAGERLDAFDTRLDRVKDRVVVLEERADQLAADNALFAGALLELAERVTALEPPVEPELP